jgi:beta-glucosidase/6-phospho-beta-glucosidase/beta-galactosidase
MLLSQEEKLMFQEYENILHSWLMLQGVPVDGYLQWTISDNWEWADGYCPKFGLVDVDRGHNLTRVPRPSYYLYQQARFQCPHDIVLLS